MTEETEDTGQDDIVVEKIRNEDRELVLVQRFGPDDLVPAVMTAVKLSAEENVTHTVTQGERIWWIDADTVEASGR